MDTQASTSPAATVASTPPRRKRTSISSVASSSNTTASASEASVPVSTPGSLISHTTTESLRVTNAASSQRSHRSRRSTHGGSRNRTRVFQKLRKVHADRFYLESSRLEKRLARIVDGLSLNISGSSPMQTVASQVALSLPDSTIARSLEFNRRQLEQSVVSWDETSTSCGQCGQAFGWIWRKHHCRLCGKAICGRPTCSVIVMASKRGSAFPGEEHSPEESDPANGPSSRSNSPVNKRASHSPSSLDIRSCSHCGEIISRTKRRKPSPSEDRLHHLYKVGFDVTVFVSTDNGRSG